MFIATLQEKMSEVKNREEEQNKNEEEDEDGVNKDNQFSVYIDNQEESKGDKDANQDESKNDEFVNQDESKDDKKVKQDESKEDKDANQDESKEDNSIGDTTDYVSAAAELQQSNSPTNYDVTNDTKTTPHRRKGGSPKQDGAKLTSLLNDDVSDDDQLYHEKNPEDVENAVEDEGNRDNEEVEVRSLLPKRHVLLLMIFLGFAVVYSLRVNINVAIVAMVNNRTSITRGGRINIHVSTYTYLFFCMKNIS